jgi:hypothetical protein
MAKNFNRNMRFTYELIGGVGTHHHSIGNEQVDK